MSLGEADARNHEGSSRGLLNHSLLREVSAAPDLHATCECDARTQADIEPQIIPPTPVVKIPPEVTKKRLPVVLTPEQQRAQAELDRKMAWERKKHAEQTGRTNDHSVDRSGDAGLG